MTLDELETPVVVIDMNVVETNIDTTQRQFDDLGIGFRPHIKTHKIPALATRQVAAGACGIACQKLSEAEVFINAGFDNILLCFYLLDAAKIKRLRTLCETTNITAVADNDTVVARLSQGFAGADKELPVLVECDTGALRCGVQTPEEAVVLARKIDAASGLRFAGLMAYPSPESNAHVQAFLTQTRDLCIAAVGHCETISSGGTPSMANAGEAPVATEYRAGTYIYNDRSLLARGACNEAQCALHVLATVVSRPTEGRAVIDAGSKSLTSDLMGLEGFGYLPDYPDAQIIALSEEHGHMDVSACPQKPQVGARVRVIPNHVCPVSNLVDRVVFHRAGENCEYVEVAARGCVV